MCSAFRTRVCCCCLFFFINVDLAIFQPYLDLEAGDNQSLKIQVARRGNEPRSSCSASQELNHSATAAPSNPGRTAPKASVIPLRPAWRVVVLNKVGLSIKISSCKHLQKIFENLLVMRKSISRQQSLSFIDYIYLNKSKSYAGHMQAKLKQRKIILENFAALIVFFSSSKER